MRPSISTILPNIIPYCAPSCPLCLPNCTDDGWPSCSWSICHLQTLSNSPNPPLQTRDHSSCGGTISRVKLSILDYPTISSVQKVPTAFHLTAAPPLSAARREIPAVISRLSPAIFKGRMQHATLPLVYSQSSWGTNYQPAVTAVVHSVMHASMPPGTSKIRVQFAV